MSLKNNAAGGNQTAVKCSFCNCMIVLTDIQDFVLREVRKGDFRSVHYHDFLRANKGKPYTQRELALAIYGLYDLKQIRISPEPDEYCHISGSAYIEAI